MKTLSIIAFFLFGSASVLGQHLLTKPNKIVNGKKEGEWSEFDYCDTIDFEGKYHIVYGQHFSPRSVIAEGLYVENQRQGYWKQYWIVDGDSVIRFKKGGIKSIVEYKNDVPSGLVIEYYPSGMVKALGQYETYPINRYDTLQVVDWARDIDGNKMKDTIIHSTLGNRPTGKWYYFLENGELYR